MAMQMIFLLSSPKWYVYFQLFILCYKCFSVKSTYPTPTLFLTRILIAQMGPCNQCTLDLKP